MIEIRKHSPEEIEELKNDIQHKLDVLKENTHDAESIERIEEFSNDLHNVKYNSVRKEQIRLNTLNKKLGYFERFKLGLETDLDIDPGRLLGLTDGIFGMVMTLLVFGIALPELQIANYSDFTTFISTLMPTIGVTIVSFVLISSFWIYHHEFIKIKKLNIPYLWINILFLICISFIPFTTSLIGNYSHFFLSEALFGLNIFLTIVFFLLMYHYADSRRFFEIMPSEDEKKYIIHTFLMIMGLTVVVNLLDFNVSGKFIYLFFLVPVISTLRDINFKIKS